MAEVPEGGLEGAMALLLDDDIDEGLGVSATRTPLKPTADLPLTRKRLIEGGDDDNPREAKARLLSLLVSASSSKDGNSPDKDLQCHSFCLLLPLPSRAEIVSCSSCPAEVAWNSPAL